VGGSTGHDRDAERGVSAGVSVQFSLNCGERAIPFGSQPQCDTGGMAFGVNQHAFTACEQQFDWFVSSYCKQRGVDLTSDIFFTAKGTASFLTSHTHFFERQASSFGDLPAVLKGDLRADIQVETFVLPGNGDGTLRLHEEVVHEGSVKSVFDNHIGFFKAGLDVALVKVDMLEQVALLVDFFSVFFVRLAGVTNHRSLFVFRLDQFDGFVGYRLGFSSDKSDSVALVAHAFADPDQDRPIFLVNAVISFVLQVTCCKNFDNARKLLRLSCVQAKQDGRGNASTQDTGIKHPFKMQIISEFCCTNSFGDRIRTSEGLADVSEVLLSKRNLAKLDVILLAHGFGSGLDGGRDGFITAAAADNVIHFLANLVQTWVGVAMKEGVCSHQLTGCAETALDGTMADKSFLERVECFEVFALVLLVVRAQST